MTTLGLAVAVLAIAVVFNLLITFAVLRRLRSHEERLAGHAGAGDPGMELLGRALPEFEATSTAGDLVSHAGGPGRLVGFFSATCLPCREQATEFARNPDPGRLAFVLMENASAADREAILAALDGSPAIMAEPVSTHVATTMGVHTFPQIVQLDADGIVVGARHSVQALAAAGG